MSNALLITVYAALAAISVGIILLTCRKKKRGRLDASLVFVTLMLLGWQLGMIPFFACTDPVASAALFDLKLPFVALTMLSWFLFVVRFYGLDSYFPPRVVITLFVIPAFTFLLAVTAPHHNFIRAQLTVLEAAPVHIYQMTRGPWFWFHSIYCYALVFASFFVAVVQYRKSPKEYRLPSRLLVWGMMVSLAANVFVVGVSTPLDISLIGATFTAVLMYHSTKNYQGLGFFIQARKEAFHYIDKAMFILDEEDGIVNMNRTARGWMRRLGIQNTGRVFADVSGQMERMAVKKVELDDVQSTDYYLASGDVFSLRLKPIRDNHKNKLGAFVFITDETQNREFIEYLDQHSGMDALTGLFNRRRLDEELRRLEQEGCWPLAVLAGDLNNLKETNDELGHQQGDILLRMVAEGLKVTCPPNASIARTGGDEFIALLPGYTVEQAGKLIQAIHAVLSRKSGRYPFTASLALGAAGRESPDQPLAEVLRAADEAMYRDKRAAKARGRAADAAN